MTVDIERLEAGSPHPAFGANRRQVGPTQVRWDRRLLVKAIVLVEPSAVLGRADPQPQYAVGRRGTTPGTSYGSTRSSPTCTGGSSRRRGRRCRRLVAQPQPGQLGLLGALHRPALWRVIPDVTRADEQRVVCQIERVQVSQVPAPEGVDSSSLPDAPQPQRRRQLVGQARTASERVD